MHKITLLPGDGIGSEVAEAAQIVIEASGVKISWDIQQVEQKALDVFGDTLPVHGSAPEIVGKNIANPAALMLSGALMLRHIKETAAGDRLESAVLNVIREANVRTADLGGNAGTLEFAEAVAAKL